MVAPTASGSLTVHAADISTPAFPTLPFPVINARSLNAVVGLSQDGNGQVKALATVAGNGTVHMVLDVTGYFE